MIAGALARLEEPADEPLESWCRDGDLPALDVDESQRSLDGRPIQCGTAATVTEEKIASANVREDHGRITIDEHRTRREIDVVSDWVADPTGTGLIVPETPDGEGDWAFPLDLIASRTDRHPERLEVDVAALEDAWSSDGGLTDVWMAGSEDLDGTSIEYHDHAARASDPTIGLGFERSWGGRVVRGVVYASGYVACYSLDHPGTFVAFLEEELLPFAFVPEDDEESAQATLDDAGDEDDQEDVAGDGGDGITAPEDPNVCDHCGNEPSLEDAEIEVVDGYALCPVHAQGYRDGALTAEDIEGGGSA